MKLEQLTPFFIFHFFGLRINLSIFPVKFLYSQIFHKNILGITFLLSEVREKVSSKPQDKKSFSLPLFDSRGVLISIYRISYTIEYDFDISIRLLDRNFMHQLFLDLCIPYSCFDNGVKNTCEKKLSVGISQFFLILYGISLSQEKR